MNERSQIIADKDFWNSLEYSVSRWLSSSEEKELRRFWIDGFVPNSVRNTKCGIDVLGKAWVCKGSAQDLFEAVISVPQQMLTRRREEYVVESVSIDEKHNSVQVVVDVALKAVQHSG